MGQPYRLASTARGFRSTLSRMVDAESASSALRKNGDHLLCWAFLPGWAEGAGSTFSAP